MTQWTTQELAELSDAYQIRVAGRRADGSARTLTIVWQVVVDGVLYVRSVNGPDGQWFRGVTRNYEGFIDAGKGPRAVTYTLDNTSAQAIDHAYATKYGTGSATRSITSTLAKQTTMRIDPR